ncbi:hypothetical protein ACFVXE_15185 [Streptomyces sp. NPDC058231]|uniref:hypothetical protein n=1 Tax=Streptomyces sp. NPDC058231 TaxID=3346392 RepID=UPI0036EC70BB
MPDGVAERAGAQRDRRLLHPVQELGGQDTDTACRAAVTEMEPGPAESVHR